MDERSVRGFSVGGGWDADRLCLERHLALIYPDPCITYEERLARMDADMEMERDENNDCLHFGKPASRNEDRIQTGPTTTRTRWRRKQNHIKHQGQEQKLELEGWDKDSCHLLKLWCYIHSSKLHFTVCMCMRCMYMSSSRNMMRYINKHVNIIYPVAAYVAHQCNVVCMLNVYALCFMLYGLLCAA